jgi:hypothetical protein
VAQNEGNVPFRRDRALSRRISAKRVLAYNTQTPNNHKPHHSQFLEAFLIRQALFLLIKKKKKSWSSIYS